MKRIFLFSLSCLIMAVSCALFVHTFSQEARAQSGSYFKVIGDNGYFLVGNSMYRIQNLSWVQEQGDLLSLPVPISSLVYFVHDSYAVTETGEGYFLSGGVWHSFGFIPGGTVNVQSETWSGVKEKYRK